MISNFPIAVTTRYDIVGDIHGHADALHRLLGILGYREVDGVFRHPDRQMLFAGDFIDRGPHQREVFYARSDPIRMTTLTLSDGSRRCRSGSISLVFD
jgi:hypothetical protein